MLLKIGRCDRPSAHANRWCLKSSYPLAPIPSPFPFVHSADAFETHALYTLSCGGDFEAFNPSDNALTKLSLPRSERRFFSDVKGLRAAAAAAAASQSPTTFIPKAKNFAAIDAVLPGNILVNATLDKKHELLMQGERMDNGVVPLSDALGVGVPVTCVWAVPHDRFEDLCRQGKPAASVYKRVSSAQLVQQLFVRVPPPPWAVGGGR